MAKKKHNIWTLKMLNTHLKCVFIMNYFNMND